MIEMRKGMSGDGKSLLPTSHLGVFVNLNLNLKVIPIPIPILTPQSLVQIILWLTYLPHIFPNVRISSFLRLDTRELISRSG